MSTILNLSNKIRLENDIERLLLNTYSGAAAAYSLRKLDNKYTSDAIRVRRSSDNAEQNIGFVSNELDTASLETFVNSGNVFLNPDITSASSWTIGNSTTYNAATEAFDLSNETGLTVRQSKATANHTYTITIVIENVTSGGIKVYVGGTQSAVISTAGTHTLNITAGSSNDILGINPSGPTSCSISSFYAVDTTADGFVAIWYDQSGNAANAAQASASAQPKIVSSGSTILVNSNPTLEFNGTSYYLQASTINVPQPTSYFITYKHNNFSSDVYNDLSDGNVSRQLNDNTGGGYARAFGGASLSSSILGSINQELRYSLFNGSSSALGINGGTLDTGNAGTLAIQDMNIGKSGGFSLDGNIQEFIIYPTNQSTNRSGIETNINDHYSIY